MQDMPIVSVGLAEEEKKELLEYGGLSKGIREGVRLYLKAQKSQEIFRKLGDLQRKNSVKTTSEKEVEPIRQEREDRPR